MLTLSSEKSLARFISGGAFLATVLVLWGSVTDPVNAPKLFILGASAFAAGAIAFAMGYKELWRVHGIGHRTPDHKNRGQKGTARNKPSQALFTTQSQHAHNLT